MIRKIAGLFCLLASMDGCVFAEPRGPVAPVIKAPTILYEDRKGWCFYRNNPGVDNMECYHSEYMCRSVAATLENLGRLSRDSDVCLPVSEEIYCAAFLYDRSEIGTTCAMGRDRCLARKQREPERSWLTDCLSYQLFEPDQIMME